MSRTLLIESLSLDTLRRTRCLDRVNYLYACLSCPFCLYVATHIGRIFIQWFLSQFTVWRKHLYLDLLTFAITPLNRIHLLSTAFPMRSLNFSLWCNALYSWLNNLIVLKLPTILIIIKSRHLIHFCSLHVIMDMNVENPRKSRENSVNLRNDNFNTSENCSKLASYHLIRIVHRH